MKRLKEKTVSKSGEEASDVDEGKPSKVAKITKKASTKALPTPKLCQARTLRKNVRRKEHNDDLQNTSDSIFFKDIQSGALKSVLTIQVQSDGKRSVKENLDCNEPSNEKHFYHKVNTEKNEICCNTVNDSHIGELTVNDRLSNVENSEKTVIDRDNSLDNKEKTAIGKKHSQNSETVDVVCNNACHKKVANCFVKPFEQVVSPEKVAEVTSKVYGVQEDICCAEVSNSQNGISLAGSFNSLACDEASEKSCEFPLDDDSSLFGCVRACFNYLEEIDMNLFCKYVHRMKTHNSLHSAPLTDRKNNIASFASTVTDSNQVSAESLESEHEINHFCKESPKNSLLGTNKVLTNNDKQEANIDELEMSKGKRSFARGIPQGNSEKKLPVNQKKSSWVGPKSKSPNIENRNSKVLEQTNENGLRQSTEEAAISKSELSIMSTIKHTPVSKTDQVRNKSFDLLPNSLSSTLQKEAFHKHHHSTESHPKKKPSKEVNEKKQNVAVKLKKASRKTKLADNQVAENRCTSENLNSNSLVEKQALGSDKRTQHSTVALKGTASELNLLNVENETQQSSGKGSVSNDLYSNEDDVLDYEPTEDEVSEIQEPGFERVHLVEKGNIPDSSDALSVTTKEDNKKKRSAWEINSDDYNFDSETQDITIAPSTSELLSLDLDDDDEDSYIAEKASATQSTTKGSDTHSDITLSSVSDHMSLKEKLQSTVNSDDRTKPCFARSDDENSSYQKQVPSDKLSMSFQNMNNLRCGVPRSWRGHCFQFIQEGMCPRKNCKYKHSKPPSSDCIAPEQARINHQSGQSFQSEYVRKENKSPTIGSCERRNFACRMEHANSSSIKHSGYSFPSEHTIKKDRLDDDSNQNIPYETKQARNNFLQHSFHSECVTKENMKLDIRSNDRRNLPYEMEQLGNSVITDDSTDLNPRQSKTNMTEEMFPNTHYRNVKQISTDVLHLVSNDHWNVLCNLFDLHFDDGAFVDHLRNSFYLQKNNAGRKFQHFINFVIAQAKKELEKEKIYILGQIGCSILLEAHSSSLFEVGFDILKTLHQYDINYYYLQHNLSHSLDFPLWSIVTPSWIALIAADTCIQVEKISEAMHILESCSWALPSSDLTLEVKRKETVMRINVFQKLMEIARKRSMMKFGIKLLKMTLDIVSEDVGDTDMRSHLSAGTKQAYVHFMSTLIENHDIELALSLYMYFWKLKPELALSSDVHRAIIVLAFRNDKKMRARNLFQTCSDMGIYRIGEPNLSSLPHCLRVHTCWTIEEMEMALNCYLGQLLKYLLKWEKAVNDVDSQELFSLHIVFNESPLKQKSEFYFLSPVQLQESRERMTTAIEKLTFPLEYEQKTERTLRINPNSLKTYFTLWKIDNGYKDPVKNKQEDNELSTKKGNLIANTSSPSSEFSHRGKTNTTEITNGTENMSGNSVNDHLPNKACLPHGTISLVSAKYSDKDKLKFEIAQDNNNLHNEGQTRVVRHKTSVNRNYGKDLGLPHSVLNRNQHISLHQEVVCDSRKVLSDCRTKPVSINTSSFIRNVGKRKNIDTNIGKFSTPHLQIPSTDTSRSFPFTSCASSPASSTLSVSSSHFQQAGEKRQLKDNLNTASASSTVLQSVHKHNSHLIAKNKTALAMKFLNTPRKSNERIIKLVKKQVLPEEEKSCVQNATTNKNNCDSSKVYNFIKSQLLCHHKGQSPNDKLNKQAELLTKKFIKENVEKDSTNSLLDRKTMRVLVDFTKLHIIDKNHLI